MSTDTENDENGDICEDEGEFEEDEEPEPLICNLFAEPVYGPLSTICSFVPVVDLSTSVIYVNWPFRKASIFVLKNSKLDVNVKIHNLQAVRVLILLNCVKFKHKNQFTEYLVQNTGVIVGKPYTEKKLQFLGMSDFRLINDYEDQRFRFFVWEIPRETNERIINDIFDVISKSKYRNSYRNFFTQYSQGFSEALLLKFVKVVWDRKQILREEDVVIDLCTRNYAKVFEHLLENELVNTWKIGTRALETSCMNGCEEIVRLLMTKKYGIKFSEKQMKSSFESLCRENRVKLVQLFVEVYNFDHTFDDNYCLLKIVCVQGYVELTQYLLSVSGVSDMTHLFSKCCQNGASELIRVLLSEKNFEKIDFSKLSAKYWMTKLTEYEFWEEILMILKQAHTLFQMEIELLKKSIEYGVFSLFKYVFDNVDIQNETQSLFQFLRDSKTSPLHLCLNFDRVDMFNYAIDKYYRHCLDSFKRRNNENDVEYRVTSSIIPKQMLSNIETLKIMKGAMIKDEQMISQIFEFCPTEEICSRLYNWNIVKDNNKLYLYACKMGFTSIITKILNNETDSSVDFLDGYKLCLSVFADKHVSIGKKIIYSTKCNPFADDLESLFRTVLYNKMCSCRSFLKVDAEILKPFKSFFEDFECIVRKRGKQWIRGRKQRVLSRKFPVEYFLCHPLFRQEVLENRKLLLKFCSFSVTTEWKGAFKKILKEGNLDFLTEYFELLLSESRFSSHLMFTEEIISFVMKRLSKSYVRNLIITRDCKLLKIIQSFDSLPIPVSKSVKNVHESWPICYSFVGANGDEGDEWETEDVREFELVFDAHIAVNDLKQLNLVQVKFLQSSLLIHLLSMLPVVDFSVLKQILESKFYQVVARKKELEFVETRKNVLEGKRGKRTGHLIKEIFSEENISRDAWEPNSPIRRTIILDIIQLSLEKSNENVVNKHLNVGFLKGLESEESDLLKSSSSVLIRKNLEMQDPRALEDDPLEELEEKGEIEEVEDVWVDAYSFHLSQFHDNCELSNEISKDDIETLREFTNGFKNEKKKVNDKFICIISSSFGNSRKLQQIKDVLTAIPERWKVGQVCLEYQHQIHRILSKTTYWDDVEFRSDQRIYERPFRTFEGVVIDKFIGSFLKIISDISVLKCDRKRGEQYTVVNKMYGNLFRYACSFGMSVSTNVIYSLTKDPHDSGYIQDGMVEAFKNGRTNFFKEFFINEKRVLPGKKLFEEIFYRYDFEFLWMIVESYNESELTKLVENEMINLVFVKWAESPSIPTFSKEKQFNEWIIEKSSNLLNESSFQEAIYNSCRNGRVTKLQLILSTNRIKKIDNFKIFGVACMFGHYDIVEEILEHFVPPVPVLRFCILRSCQLGHSRIVEKLMILVRNNEEREILAHLISFFFKNGKFLQGSESDCSTCDVKKEAEIASAPKEDEVNSNRPKLSSLIGQLKLINQELLELRKEVNTL